MEARHYMVPQGFFALRRRMFSQWTERRQIMSFTDIKTALALDYQPSPTIGLSY